MNSELAINLALAGIDESTRQILRETWPAVRVRVPQVLDALYGQGGFRPNLNSEEQNNAKVAEARAEREKHWEALFAARFDEDYAASVSRIALTHVRVGLRPAWFISGYLVALTELHSLLVNTHAEGIVSWRSRSRMEQAIRAIDKAVLFDLQLGVSAYCAELGASSRRRVEDLAERCLAAATSSRDGIAALADDFECTMDGLREAAELARADALAARDDTDQAAAAIATTTAAVERSTATIRAVTQQVLAATAAADRAVGDLESASLVCDGLGDTLTHLEDTAALIVRLTAQAGALLAEAAVERGDADGAAPRRATLGAQLAALSEKAAEAAERMRREGQTARDVACRVGGALGTVRAALGHSRGASIEVADALTRQADSTRDISMASVGVTRAVARFGRGIADASVSERDRFAVMARRMRQFGAAQFGAVGAFVDEIRASERRTEPREPTSASVVLAVGAREIRGALQNVSASGAAVLIDTAQIPDDTTQLTIRVPHTASSTDMRVVSKTPHLLRLAFIDRVRGQRFMSAALDPSASLVAADTTREHKRVPELVG